MKKWNQTLGRGLGKKLGVLALSALLIGSSLTTPVSAKQPDASTEASTEDTGAQQGNDTDILLTGVNAPGAKYGEGSTVGFVARVKGNGYITSISPVISSSFPFETNDAAYMVVEGNETTKELVANYNFIVRSDVASGYQPVEFAIEYVKDKEKKSVVKTVNVKFEGAPAPTEATEAPATEAPAVSTPRVIVTGFETNPGKVLAGQNFKLTLHLKNTSNRTAVSNMKVSLAAANGEFLPTSGSSTDFIASLGAGQTTDIVMEMSALSSLDPKPYVLTLTCNYEDSAATAYESTENISIPVYQEARIKITEVTVSPDTIAVDDQGSVSFSINNLGKSTLSNVQAKIEGKTIECEETFVGNIAAGATGYADVTVTGVESTQDDGKVKLVITYEDSAGEECTYEEEVTVMVTEASYDPGDMDGSDMDQESTKSGPSVILIVIGILVAIAVIVVVIVIIVSKNKKRKAAKEAEELEDAIDEDLLSDADKENKE